MLKKENRRSDNRINAGSVADIAFLLLIFFLVTTTILEDHGVLVKLPPIGDDFIQPIPERNVFSVKINAQDQLLVEGEQQTIAALRNATKEFIVNPNKRKDLPQSPRKAT